MSLQIDIRQRLGAFRLEARFETSARLTALFGRSGSGKTSLVNLLAGLARPDEGRIAMGDAVFVDTSTRRFLPAHRRRVGYVFQDARLFPHLSVRHNLLYGRWFARRRDMAARAGQDEFDRIVELLGIAPLLARRPAGLSGGERQRVAIGRALLSHPRLLLMDEPLAALDEARKAEILPYLERLRDEAAIPILYVSHSVTEVLRLAADMVVLEAGRVVAQGPPAEIMRRLDLLPSAYESESGRDLVVTVEGEEPRYGLTVLALGEARLFVPRLAAAPGASLRLRVRARDVMLALEAPTGISALNVLPATVVGFSPDGASGMELRLDCAGQELLSRITLKSFEALELRVGSPVHAVLKAVSFDRRYGGDLSTEASGEA
ncbi:molybdenum import ATP-binding protein ModC [Aureimonas endophytica]|uniref:Molybdenum import ATP-binding protein ModC n=1 Tax=Aureimonas endophytica TaxID=2027858 RepID=A0A916ZS01_9HYPH|nr:molybdenum ABC transporter ATP-binding protein [Aureimonas endophytica]GGE10021.1 molybdenum import ATP-binding protein ModC [Aureimonas endophytica]